MKRFAALLLAFILILSLCACGKTQEELPAADNSGNIIRPAANACLGSRKQLPIPRIS